MKKLALAILLASLAVASRAGEPVSSPDALEAELNACLTKGGRPNRCAENILGRRILPGNDQLASVAKQIDELMAKWLGKDTVYAIHPVRTKRTGDLFESRTYLLEDSRGSLCVLDWSLLKRLGKWYVFQFNFNSGTAEVKAALGAD